MRAAVTEVPSPTADGSADVTAIRTLAIDDVYERLRTSPAGLSEAAAQERRRLYGPNRIQEAARRPIWYNLFAQFTNFFALLLWVGSGLAFSVGEAKFGIAIIAVIVINGVFSFWQEYQAERATEALKRLLPQAARVLRDGEEQGVAAEDLVPGDVVVLAEGDHVSADCRLAMAYELRTDDSVLTGESRPVRKMAEPVLESGLPVTESHNLVFAGTSVAAGRGLGVVYAIGMSSQFGRIAGLTQRLPEGPSPLQKEMVRVARRVAVIALSTGILFFVIGHWLADLSWKDGGIFAVGIVLANVPEGLLPTLSLALALGVQRMARRNALIKRLSSVETLGATTVICTDKTGTLTENEMTVREVWFSRRRLQVSGAGYDPHGTFSSADHPLTADELKEMAMLFRIAAFCNTSRLVPPSPAEPRWTIVGDPTEAALLVAAAKGGFDLASETKVRPRVYLLPFDSRRKRMSSIHREPQEQGGGLVAYVKGAPREMLALCDYILLNERVADLDEERRAEITACNDDFARAGLRVLAMAYREMPPLEPDGAWSPRAEDVERGLVFAGLMAMMDPPRPAVAEAVAKCRRAGIRIVMITGDYGLTAEAIARRIGIIHGEHTRVIAGSELESMTDAELHEALMNENVLFARVSPEHKLRIVTAFQARGEVVAVTGDGVNDAPALRKADIGVAMGLSGTDVAREAATMVLANDNFASIVAAVEEGRTVFDNIRKFVVYIFAHLSPEAVPIILFALFSIPLPITVMQILAIDLGTETLPALALGSERAEPDIMDRPPRPRTRSLLDLSSLWRGYGFLGMMSAAAVMGGYFWVLRSSGWQWAEREAPTDLIGKQAATMVFMGIVIMQVANVFACRTERASVFSVGILTNRLVLVGIVFELALLALLMYAPFLQPVFDTASLGVQHWAYYFAIVPLVLLAEEGRKWLLRRGQRISKMDRR